MVGIKIVITVCHDQERMRAADPAAQEPDEIERGFITPMSILSHEHVCARCFLQRREHGAKDEITGSVGVKRVFDLRTQGGGDVIQRAKWTWHAESVARNDLNPNAIAHRFRKVLDKGRFAPASFSTQE